VNNILSVSSQTIEVADSRGLTAPCVRHDDTRSRSPPGSIAGLYRGENLGKRLIRIAS